MSSNDPILIVGGGIAGLTCARSLTRAGHQVLLLEREDELGGRVRTTVRDGFRIDHGFQVLFSSYPVLTHQLDLTALDLRAFRPAARIVSGAGDTALIGDALSDASLLLPTIMASPLSLLDKLRMLRLRSLATSLTFDECFATRFDRLSTRDFLRQRGFSGKAISNFFSPFYGGILLDRSLESSASVLLYTFKMLAEGRTMVPAAGMGAIPAQLAASLPPGAVRTGAAVTRLITESESPGVRGVMLATGEQIAATTVVLACDPPTIASLAITAHVHVEIPTASLGCTTAYLRSRSPLLAGDALWLNAAPGATVSHAITISNVAPSYAPRGESLTAATVLGAAAVLDDAELIPRIRTDLAMMGGNPESAHSELLAVWRVPYSQYAQPPGTVGRRVSAVTTVPGLFLASELWHTSSLEGAARGGIAAADAVMRSAI
ncbi:MAG: NAD(P)/FAD-dependent oxidoreductase [Gemmatimonadaceae bacterium]|nr:NAD(P)/FAD-dependent oxidoreductase [Gemmatimonadaceae bacterium]